MIWAEKLLNGQNGYILSFSDKILFHETQGQMYFC